MPECETVVRDIRPFIESAAVVSNTFSGKLSLPEDVNGRKIRRVWRHGKWIIFDLDAGCLVSHLRMTGQWRFSTSSAPEKFDRGYFKLLLPGLKEGFLIFSDIRKFGTLEYVPNLTAHAGYMATGPDGMRAKSLHSFVLKRAEKSSRPIKNFLLDQSVISGCGNIYCSDLLWRIKINPNTPAKECLDKIPIICDTLVEIFEEAIEMRGSSVVDFAGGSYQNVLKAYGRVGEPCYRCDTKIERIVQAGRSTFFCPQCQR